MPLGIVRCVDTSCHQVDDSGRGDRAEQGGLTLACGMRPEVAGTRAATQGGDDVDVLAGPDGVGEALGGLTPDEEADVGTDAILLVHHPEADARVAPVEVGEDIGEAPAPTFHLRAPARVGVKRRGDEDPHQASEAALTE